MKIAIDKRQMQQCGDIQQVEDSYKRETDKTNTFRVHSVQKWKPIHVMPTPCKDGQGIYIQ